MEHISSRQNPLVKRLRELSRGRGGDGEVLLEGPHLLEEASNSGVPIEVALFASDAADGRLAALVAQTRACTTRIVTMPPALFEAISPARQSAGVLAIARPVRASMSDVLERTPALVVVLDAVQDPGNVGAIIRAAEACGGTGVITGPGSADPFGWKALRGSMGSAFRLPVAATDSLAVTLRECRGRGVRLIAAVPRGGTRLAHARLDRPAAVLLGGEGPGLPADVLALADEQITIEMQPPVESLNVAISAALILYEASRQRSHVAVR